MKSVLLATLIFIGLVAQARAQQFITVDFSSGELWHLYGEGQRDVYPIVLPREDVQQTMKLSRPVIGTLTDAVEKPTWYPTDSMRTKNPALPESISYGAPGHPLGFYKFLIEWNNPVDANFWASVRIHGGARDDDLYKAKSAGCVRMRDVNITRLVDTINYARVMGDTEVQVSFGYFSQ